MCECVKSVRTYIYQVNNSLNRIHMKLDQCSIILVQTISIIVSSQILKVSQSRRPQSIVSLIKGDDGTFFQSINYLNKSLNSFQYQTQQHYNFPVQIQGQIKHFSFGQRFDETLIPCFSNGTVVRMQNIYWKFNDTITQILVLKNSSELFVMTKTYFYWSKNSIIFLTRSINEQIVKLMYSYKLETLFAGTKNGSILVFKKNEFYEKSRVLYFNFQQRNLNVPINVVLDQRDYNVTIIGNVKFSQNKELGLGISAVFDGSSYLVLNNFGNLNSFTVCAWFKSNNARTDFQRIFADFQNALGFALTINGHRLRLSVRDNIQLQSNIIQSNIWYHGTAILDKQKNTLKLFLDGILVMERYYQLSIDDPGPLSIGGGTKLGHSNYFKGNIDQAMVFDSALEDSQIVQIFEQRKWLKTQIKAKGEITCIENSLDGTQLYFGDNFGSIYGSDINNDLAKMQINRKYKSHNSSINSIVEYKQSNKKYLISSDQQGQIIMTNTMQDFGVIDKKIVGLQGFRDTFIGNIKDQNKFLSTNIGTNSIIEWEIYTNQSQKFLICNQSYSTCQNILVNAELRCHNLYNNSEILINVDEGGQFCVLQCGNQLNLLNGRCFQRIQSVKVVSLSISTALSIPSVRGICKFLLPMFDFLQQMWFYSFHKRRYSVFVETIFQQTNKINNQRIIPNFLDFSAFERNIDAIGQDQMKIYAEISPTWLIQKEKLYTVSYWENTKKIWIISNIYTIGGLATLLLLGLFVRKYLGKYKIFRTISSWLLAKTVLLHIIFGVIELNLAALSYFTFIQLKNPSFVNIASKASIIFALLSLFVLIFYSICFYWLAFAFSTKKYIGPLLNNKKVNFSSFTVQTLLSASKKVMNSFIHSSYQLDYKIQIALICTVNIVQLITIIKLRGCYDNKLFFLLTVCYRLSLTLLDLVYLISYCFDHIVQYTDYIQMFLFIIIAVSVVLLILTTFLVDTHSFYKMAWVKFKYLLQKLKNKVTKNNRVRDNIHKGKSSQTKLNNKKIAKDSQKVRIFTNIQQIKKKNLLIQHQLKLNQSKYAMNSKLLKKINRINTSENKQLANRRTNIKNNKLFLFGKLKIQNID